MKFIVLHCTKAEEEDSRPGEESIIIAPLQWTSPPTSPLRMLSCIRHTHGNRVTLKLSLRTHAAE